MPVAIDHHRHGPPRSSRGRRAANASLTISTAADSCVSNAVNARPAANFAPERLEVAVADAVHLRLRRVLGARGRRFALDDERIAPADFERQEIAAACRLHAGLLANAVEDRRVRLRDDAHVR
mgnify:CR=1 FL=1